jgi:hypothetical protein
VKELWKAAVAPTEGKQAGVMVPRLSSIVGMVKLVKKIGFGSTYNAMKGTALLSSNKMIDILRTMQTVGVVDIETPAIDINLNEYIRDQFRRIDEIVPEESFSSGFGGPDLSEAWKDIPELNIHYDPFSFITDFDDPNLNEKDLWRQAGFASWMLIDVKDWLNDAGGYIASPGIYASEALDDVLGIIFPAIGWSDLILDLAGSFKKGLQTMNKYVDGYNSMRANVISILSQGRDSIIAFLQDWTDVDLVPEQLTSEILEYLHSHMDDVIDIFEALPELFRVPDWMVELIPEIEVGLIDSERPLSVFGDLAQLALWGPVGELIQYYMSYAKKEFDVPMSLGNITDVPVEKDKPKEPAMPPPINWL